MDEWWTYELSDLVLFSSHTYYRLIELYNLAVWPVQLLALLFSFALLYLAIQHPKNHGKIITGILLTSWLWVAWAFLWQRFATIHWVASYYAIGFVIECALLIWIGIVKDNFTIPTGRSIQQKLGLALLLFAIFAQPYLMMLVGHNWKQAELFAITPDSTIIATMGLLLLTDLKKTGWLLAIPLLWCMVSTATLWVLNSVSAIGLIAATLVVLPPLMFSKTRYSLIS